MGSQFNDVALYSSCSCVIYNTHNIRHGRKIQSHVNFAINTLARQVSFDGSLMILCVHGIANEDQFKLVEEIESVDTRLL